MKQKDRSINVVFEMEFQGQKPNGMLKNVCNAGTVFRSDETPLLCLFVITLCTQICANIFISCQYMVMCCGFILIF